MEVELKVATTGGDSQGPDEEAVIRRMLNTPPQPRKKKPKIKEAARPNK